MLWAVGTVFIAFVALFAIWLYRNSDRNRRSFIGIPRGRRILLGVTSLICSFGSALSALKVAVAIRDWNQPSLLSLIGIMLFMVVFVALQVGSMLSFISLAFDAETTDPPERP